MEKQFISYELALKLKELGFDEECLAYYDSGQFPLFLIRQNDKTKHTNSEYDTNELYKGVISAPLWQQAFDWFRENYGIHSYISLTNIQGELAYHVKICSVIKYEIGINRVILYNLFDFKNYKDAQKTSLEKLIELCKNK